MTFQHKINKEWKKILEYEQDIEECNDTTKQDAIRLELYFLYKDYIKIIHKLIKWEDFEELTNEVKKLRELFELHFSEDNSKVFRCQKCNNTIELNSKKPIHIFDFVCSCGYKSIGYKIKKNIENIKIYWIYESSLDLDANEQNEKYLHFILSNNLKEVKEIFYNYIKKSWRNYRKEQRKSRDYNYKMDCKDYVFKDFLREVYQWFNYPNWNQLLYSKDISAEKLITLCSDEIKN